MDPTVAIIIGSKTDMPVVEESKIFGILDQGGVTWNLDIISVHRNASTLKDRCEQLIKDGVKAIITAAGMAALLPSSVASHVKYMLPVIGAALPSEDFPDAIDSVFSIARPPAGCPVAIAGTGIAGLRNAATFVVQMLKNKPEQPFVLIVPGSDRDFQVIEEAEMINVLDRCKVGWDRLVWSPENFIGRYKEAIEKGTKIFITGYRFANLFKEVTVDIQSAPLVISIPLPSDNFSNAEAALESIARLPIDYPAVSTGIGKAGLRNAALFTAQILATGDNKKGKEIKDGLTGYFNTVRKEPQLGYKKSQRKEE